MNHSELSISTTKKQECVDITNKVDDIIKKSGFRDDLCNIFTKHTTASISVMENYDPNICIDTLEALEKIAPNGIWRHDKVDENADAHIKSAIVGSSETIPIKDGRLDLGKWQSLNFVEFDGPRNDRKVVVSILRG